MSARGTELLDQILTLPPQERAQLAEQILDSLTPPTARAIEQMCADEAEARLDAYERGEIQALSEEEAIEWLNGNLQNETQPVESHGQPATIHVIRRETKLSHINSQDRKYLTYSSKRGVVLSRRGYRKAHRLGMSSAG